MLVLLAERDALIVALTAKVAELEVRLRKSSHNASGDASPTSASSTANSPPGPAPPTATSAKSTGDSPPATPALNSETYTRCFKSDGRLAPMLQ